MKLNQVTVPCIDYTTLSIHAAASVPESSGITIYFEVDDVDATVRELEGNGLQFDAEPVDQNWLWREAYLHDPAGNVICIFHGGKNRRNPPWRVAE